MIRVVYTWKVVPENFPEFQQKWRYTTNKIHREVDGALGSFMLRSSDDETKIITVAKWKSFEDWKTFWGQSTPKEMQNMHELGERLSVEAFEEIEDHTH